MKKIAIELLVLVNLCGCLCLVYFGASFISGSVIIDFPAAMLPMERWERGGLALTAGALPLIIANTLGYVFLPFGDKKSRLLIFIPSIVCIALVICYWAKSLA